MLSITTDTLDMYYSAPTLGHIILLPPVGQRIPAVDFVMWATKKDRKESKNEIEDVMMFAPDRETLKKIFHRKEYVPGELESDYVLTYDQCYELLNHLDLPVDTEDAKDLFKQTYAFMKSERLEPESQKTTSMQMETANYVLKTLLCSKDYEGLNPEHMSQTVLGNYRDCFFKLVHDLKQTYPHGTVTMTDAPPITTFFQKADLKDEPRITRQSKKARLGL